MEITLLLLLIVGFGIFWYYNQANKPETPFNFNSGSPNLDTPPEKDAYTPPVVEPVVEAAPAKKPRKPRAPKTEVTKKAASKKPAAVKTAGATKSRRTKSKTA